MPGATFLMSPGSGTSPQGKRSCASRRRERSAESSMAETSLGGGSLSRPPADCPPCDITPAEAPRPVDQVDRAVSPRAGLLDGRGHGGDVQHTPAIGQHAPAIGFGAGMEDLHALDLARRLEPTD